MIFLLFFACLSSGLSQSLDNKNAVMLGCRFMKSNGLKFVTVTSINQPLMRRLEFSMGKFALEENILFRARPFGSDSQSMYHQDSYLILASAKGICTRNYNTYSFDCMTLSLWVALIGKLLTWINSCGGNFTLESMQLQKDSFFCLIVCNFWVQNWCVRTN